MRVHFPTKPSYYNYIEEKKKLAQQQNKSKMGNSQISQAPATLARDVKNNLVQHQEIFSKNQLTPPKHQEKEYYMNDQTSKTVNDKKQQSLSPVKPVIEHRLTKGVVETRNIQKESEDEEEDQEQKSADEQEQESIEEDEPVLYTKEKFAEGMKAMKRKRILLLKLCRSGESDPDTYQQLFLEYKKTFSEHSALLNWVQANEQGMPKHSKSVTKEKSFVSNCYKALGDKSSDVWSSGEFNLPRFAKFVEDNWSERFTPYKQALSAIDERTEGSAYRFDEDGDSYQGRSLTNSQTPREEVTQNLNKIAQQEKEKRLSIQNQFQGAPETVNEVSQSKEHTELEGEDDEDQEARIPTKNEDSKRHRSRNQSRNHGREEQVSEEEEEFFSQNSDFEDAFQSKKHLSNKFEHSRNSANGGFNMSDFEDAKESSASQNRRSSSSAKPHSKDDGGFGNFSGFGNPNQNKSDSFGNAFAQNSKDFGSGVFGAEEQFNSYDMNDNKDDAFAQFGETNFESGNDQDKAFANFGDFNTNSKPQESSPKREQVIGQGKFQISVNQENARNDPSSEEEPQDDTSSEPNESNLNRSLENQKNPLSKNSAQSSVKRQASLNSEQQVHRPNSQSVSKANQSDANASSRTHKSTTIQPIVSHIQPESQKTGRSLNSASNSQANPQLTHGPAKKDDHSHSESSTHLQTALTRISNMQIQIDMLNQTNAELQAQIHNTSQVAIKVEEVEEYSKSLEARVNQLNGENQKLKSENEKMAAQNLSLEKKVKSLEKNMEQVVGNLTQDQQKMHALLKEIELLKGQNEHKDLEMIDLKQQKIDAEFEVEELKKRNLMLKDMDKQYSSELELTRSTLEAKLQTLKQGFESERNMMLLQRKKEIQALKNQIQETEKENFDLKAKILSSKSKEVSEIAIESPAERQTESPEGMVEIYKQRSQEAADEIARLKEQILDVKTELVKVQNQLEIEQNKSKYLEKSLNSIGGDKKSHLDDLQGVKNDLLKKGNEIRKLISEQEVLQKKISFLEHEVETGLKRESELMKEVEDYHQRLVNMSQEVKETSYVFNHDTSFKLEKENQTLVVQNQTLRAKLEELMEINLDLKQKLTETEINQSLVSTDVSIHLEELTKATASNQSFQQQLLASNRRILELQSQLIEKEEREEDRHVFEGEIELIRSLLSNKELMESEEGREVLTSLVAPQNSKNKVASLRAINSIVQKLLEEQINTKMEPAISEIETAPAIPSLDDNYFARLLSLDSRFKELLLHNNGILVNDERVKVTYEVLNRLYARNNEIDIEISITAKSEPLLLSHISFKSESRVQIIGQVTGHKINRDQTSTFGVKFSPEDMANFLNPILTLSYSFSDKIYQQESVIPLSLFQIVLRVKSEHEKCSGIYDNFSKSISIDIPFNQSYTARLKTVIPELIEFDDGKYWLLCNSPSERNFVVKLEQYLGNLRAEIKCASIDQFTKNYLELLKYLFCI